MQRARFGGQRQQQRVILRQIQAVAKYVHPLGEPLVKLNHAPRQLQREVGLPLICGDHQRFRRRRTNEQLSQPEHRRQRGFSVRPRDADQRRTDTGCERAGHNVPLKRTQLDGAPGTVTARDNTELADKPQPTLRPIPRPAFEAERRDADRSLRASPH